MTNVPTSPLATYRTVEMQTCGESVRLILDGFPEPRGATVLEKRHAAAARLDLHRRRLMLEPRGHAEMYGALVVPTAPPAAFGALFMHHSGFSTMCGHATIARGRWAADRGPAAYGTAISSWNVHATRWRSTSPRRAQESPFDSVPAFAAALDTAVAVPSHRGIVCDIGYGGAYYARA
jgi:proline racemase